MRIKAYRAVLIATIILVIISTIIAIYYKTSFSSSEINNAPKSTEYEYLLKSVDGNVCVFKHDSSEPIQVLNIYLNSLPVADRMELINGIKLKDDAALSQAIEDYES